MKNKVSMILSCNLTADSLNKRVAGDLEAFVMFCGPFCALCFLLGEAYMCVLVQSTEVMVEKNTQHMGLSKTRYFVDAYRFLFSSSAISCLCCLFASMVKEMSAAPLCCACCCCKREGCWARHGQQAPKSSTQRPAQRTQSTMHVHTHRPSMFCFTPAWLHC